MKGHDQLERPLPGEPVPLKIAFSPCPNDTYLFHGWVSGAVGPKVSATLADIQTLNEIAKAGIHDLVKVSCAVLPYLPDTYRVLPIGAAIGKGCGPLLVAKNPFPLTDLSKQRVAIPGKDTTAHLLLNRLAPLPAEKIFCPYQEVEQLVLEGRVDAGVLIHEQRFTYAKNSLIKIADLGERFGGDIPLGCLVAKPVASKAIDILRQSLALATQNPPMAYMKQHAQEMDEDTIQKHVALYVTHETHNLSQQGIAAIANLIGKTPKEFYANRFCPSP